MIPSETPDSSAKSEPTQSCMSFRRVCQWCLLILLAVPALIILFYGEEKLRGSFMWNRYRSQLESQGVKLRLADVANSQIPDGSNFACQPALNSLYDFKPGTQERVDTNGYQQLEERRGAAQLLAKQLGYRGFPGGGRWRKAQKTDMNELLAVPSTSERETLLRDNQALLDKYQIHNDASNRVDLRAIPSHILKKYNINNLLANSTNLIPIPSPLEPTMAASNVLYLFSASATGALLDEVQAARLQRPECRFKIAYDYPASPAILLPHLSVVKSLAQNFKARALARLHLGQVDGAFNDTVMALYMGDTLEGEPFLISLLVRIALHEIAMQPVWEGLAEHRWSAKQLIQLQAMFDGFDILKATRKVLDGERACANQTIEALKNGALNLKEINDVFGSMTEYGGQIENYAQEFWRDKLLQVYPKGWLYQEQIAFNRLYDSFIKRFLSFENEMISPAKIQEYDRETRKLQEGALGMLLLNHRLVAGARLPSFGKAYQKSANSQAVNNLALIACALERYRLDRQSYPKTLEALVPTYVKKLPFDVITGKAPVYHAKTDGTFLLYSVGWNEKDDGGLLVLHESGNVAQDEGDWVWQYTTPNIRMVKQK